MSGLDSQDIIKVVDCLIGNVEPYGDTNVDKIRLCNLKKLIDLTNWCLDGVLFASEGMKHHEASMFEIGWTAKQSLDQWRVWLKELFEED